MVSIVIPVYNAIDTISDTINSILKQKNMNYEIIVVDDGSDDGTYELLRNISIKFFNMRVYRIEHSGVSNARNFGLDFCLGKYIFFLDSDDVLFSPYTLSILVSIAECNEIDIVWGRIFDSDIQKKSIPMNNMSELKKYDGYNLISDMQSTFCECRKQPSQFLIRREFLDSKNIWFESCMFFEDNKFLFDVLMNNPKIMYTDTITIIKRCMENSVMNSHKYDIDLFRIYKIIVQKIKKSDLPNKKYLLQHIIQKLEPKIFDAESKKIYQSFVKLERKLV